jgi:NADPH:quinone reductase-like Zn-dependent oxidoreductase
MELAGVVESVGASATEFAVGDEVFGVKGFGAWAELVTVRETSPLARKPANVTFETAAAAIDGAALALACFRKADVRAGQSILIYGASGAVGTAAVQLARHTGAEVTAVCNTKNVELVRSLGADEVIDYTREDFTKIGRTYDVVFDAVGKTSFRRTRRLLKRGGTFVDTDPGYLWHVFPLAFLTRWIGSKKVALGITAYSKADVEMLAGLLATGEYRPVIDRTYPLSDVIKATRYVETGQKTGNVVLLIGEPPATAGGAERAA